jgi:hypothetical protein
VLPRFQFTAGSAVTHVGTVSPCSLVAQSALNLERRTHDDR